jgi:hypothetical protein
MAQIISLQNYKETKLREREYNAKCKEQYKIVRKLSKSGDKEIFDLELIKLIELFLQKEFPDYGWKFDIFLDKYYNEKT